MAEHRDGVAHGAEAPEERGGAPACDLHRVCEACGALEDGPPPPVCGRCGARQPGAPARHITG